MGRNFSPARKVLSITAPSAVRLSLVRTNAPPLPGFTCWNSTILKTVPSTSIWVPFLNWLVLIMPPVSVGRRTRLKWRAVSLDAVRMEPNRLPSRARADAALALAALAVAGAVVALAQPALGDYTHTRAATNTDNAAPVIDAVLRGDLGRVPSSQPVMGPVSVVLRLPFAAVARAIGGRQLEYWLGCVACLWALALLAIVLAARVRRRQGGLAGPAVVVLVLVANPLT